MDHQSPTPPPSRSFVFKKHYLWPLVILLAIVLSVFIFLNRKQDVRILHYSPTNQANIHSSIDITFNMPMSARSVEANFSISPAINGDITWPTTSQLRFIPEQPLLANQTYQISLAANTQNIDLKKSLEEAFSFSFTVQSPDIIFLGPASVSRVNFFRLNLATQEAQQLTDVDGSILDYALSPDGAWIAYSLRRNSTLSDIWAYNLANGQSTQLSNCAEVEATCDNPSWHPLSTRLAYSRRELSESGGRTNTDHVWIVDINTRQNTLLFDDTELEGCCPKWSPSGERIAIARTYPQGILVYDFPTQKNLFINTQQGLVGATFSPSGDRLIYPTLELNAINANFYQSLEMVNFGVFGTDDPTISLISNNDEGAIEYIQAAFHPDGQKIAYVRRYADWRYTSESDVYILDFATQTATLLITEAGFGHGYISWSADGNLLLMQRYNNDPANEGLSIWVYTNSTGEFQQVYNDGFLPRFLP